MLKFINPFELLKNKRALFLIIFSATRIILMIAINNFLTGILNYENISTYYLIMSIYSIFVTIIIGPYGEYIEKIFFKIKKNYDITFFLESFYKSFVIPVAILSFLILFIGFIIFQGFDNMFFIKVPLLVSLLIVFKTIFDFNNSFINILGKYKIYSLLSISFILLSAFFAFLFVRIYDSNYFFWTLGFVFSNMVLSTFSILYFRRNFKSNKSRISFKISTNTNSFIPFLILGNLMVWFLTDGFRFFAENRFGLQNSGVLILAFATASQMFSIINNTISPIFTPDVLKGFSLSEKKDRIKSLKLFYLKTLPILIITLITSIFFSKWILKILIHESKINSDLIKIFIVALIVEFIKSTISIFKQYNISENKLKHYAYAIIIPCFLMFLSPYIPYINNLYFFSIYILLIYLVYFVISYGYILKIKKT